MRQPTLRCALLSGRVLGHKRSFKKADDSESNNNEKDWWFHDWPCRFEGPLVNPELSRTLSVTPSGQAYDSANRRSDTPEPPGSAGRDGNTQRSDSRDNLLDRVTPSLLASWSCHRATGGRSLRNNPCPSWCIP